MSNQLITLIKAVIPLSVKEEETVLSLFQEKVIKKGDYFLKEGQICKYAALVTKGVFRYYINKEGEDKTYSFAQENNFICDYESFIPQQPTTKNIQALEDCQIVQISFTDLQTFYNTVTGGEKFGRMIIEQVFIRVLQELTSFYIDTPELRYEKFLNNHSDLQQRISQYHIASYVGVKPQSLSRIRKRIATQK